MTVCSRCRCPDHPLTLELELAQLSLTVILQQEARLCGWPRPAAAAAATTRVGPAASPRRPEESFASVPQDQHQELLQVHRRHPQQKLHQQLQPVDAAVQAGGCSHAPLVQ